MQTDRTGIRRRGWIKTVIGRKCDARRTVVAETAARGLGTIKSNSLQEAVTRRCTFNRERPGVDKRRVVVAFDPPSAIRRIRFNLRHIDRQRAVITNSGLVRRVGYDAIGSPLFALDRDVGRAEVREVAARQIGGVGRRKEVDTGNVAGLD